MFMETAALFSAVSVFFKIDSIKLPPGFKYSGSNSLWLYNCHDQESVFMFMETAALFSLSDC